jgi:small subunit ribosomal protein S16
MSVKIKLSRVGKKNAPLYRIVVMEESKRRDGKYIENIGFYNPIANPHLLEVDREKLTLWIKKGAQMSDGVAKLLK